MFSNAPSRQEIDRLNAVWDDVVRGNTGSGSEAEMAHHLQLLAPALNSAAKQRLRMRVLATQPGGTALVRSIEPVMLRTPLTAPKRIGRSVFLRLAAVLLLMLGIVGAWFGARQFGDDDPTPTPLLGAIPASPNAAASSPRETLFQLNIPPAGLRQFTLALVVGEIPANQTWDLSTGVFALGNQALSFYVTSGTLSVTTGQTTKVYETGAVISGVLPSEIQAVGTEPVELVAVFAFGSGDYLPPTLYSDRGFQVLGIAPVKQPAGVPLTISFSRVVTDGPDADPIQASDDERVAMVWVTAGSMTLDTPAGESVMTGLGTFNNNSQFAPSSGEPMTLVTDDVAMADVGSTLGRHGAVVGSEPFSAYVVTEREGPQTDVAEDEHRNSAAMNWALPTDAEQIGMAVRFFTLKPGAVYHYSFSGAAAYHVYAGSVTVELGEQSQTLGANDMVVQIGDGELAITNVGPDIALVEQATASVAVPSGQLVHPVYGVVDGVTVDTYSAGDLPVPSGVVEVQLEVVPVDNSVTINERDQAGLALIAVEYGVVSVSDVRGARIGRVVPNPGSTFKPEGMLFDGDYLLAPDGATYTITGVDESVTTLLWFSIAPNPDGASPIAILTPVDQADLSMPSPTPVPAYSVIEPLSPTATP